MRNIHGRVPESALSRFLLGAGFGIAISVPLFLDVEDIAVRVLLMVAFAAVMGGSQVLAGGSTERSRRATLLMLVACTFALIAGVLLFLVVN